MNALKPEEMMIIGAALRLYSAKLKEAAPSHPHGEFREATDSRNATLQRIDAIQDLLGLEK